MFSWKEKVTDKLSHLRPDSTSSGSNLSGESDVVRLGAKDSPLGEEETSSRAEKLSSYLFSYIPASLTNFDTHKLTSIGHVTLPSLPSIPSLPSLPSLPKRWKGHGFVWSGEKFDENSDEELDQSPVEIVKVEKAPPSPLTRSLPSAIREDSSFISTPLFEFLESSLPNLVKGCEWVLLYSTLKHGISLRTLLRRSSGLPGPCLLIVGDMEGAVFGGLLEAPVNPTAKRKYQGNCQAFVFTTKYGDPRLFRATGANRYYYLCMEEMLAFGGGGHFALCLDGDLLHGTSGPSDTFGNACLAHNSEFELKNVELWGFTHQV
ncbi:TLD-domain containing nucleolar protein [Wolffia australiana]